VLGLDISRVFRLVRRDSAGSPVARNVHAHELGEVAKVLDLDPSAKLGFERGQLGGVIARR
jgi:hypothetical protein